MDTILSRDQKINEIILSIVRQETPLSYSALSAFSKGPREFIKYKLKETVQTDAMIYGSMVHCLVLEPEKFDDRYFVIDTEAKKLEIGGAKPGATTKYKEWVTEMQQKAGKKVLVSSENYKMAQSISLDTKYNSPASKILSLCPKREEKVQWVYLPYIFHGFKDASGSSAIADLKTLQDATPSKVAREIYYEGHYIQAAMYLMADLITQGENPHSRFKKDYYIIAVDQKGGVSCHQISKGLLEKGRKQFMYLVEKFSMCVLEDGFDKSHDFFSDRVDGIYLVDRPF